MSRRIATRGLAAVALLELVGACASAAERAKEELVLGAVPGLARPARVMQTSEAGPYLNAVIERGDGSRSLYFTPDAACGQLLQEGEEVELVNDGSYGRVERGEVQCTPVGIGALANWRNRLTRGQTRRRVRKQANYTQVSKFEGGYALRGQFELVGLVQWVGAHDTVVLVGDDEACRAVAERPNASLEFRPSGDEAFLLLAGAGPCPIQGLVRPEAVAAPAP